MKPTYTVALAGDILLCPTCEEPLARFKGGKGFRIEVLDGGRKRSSGPGRASLTCMRCGGGAFKATIFQKGNRNIDEASNPSMLVQSGNWKGWRDLGGE